jgi:hypothetical protein
MALFSSNDFPGFSNTAPFPSDPTPETPVPPTIPSTAGQSKPKPRSSQRSNPRDPVARNSSNTEFLSYENSKSIDKKDKTAKSPGGTKYGPVVNHPYDEITTKLAKERFQYIHIYHIPTKTEIKFKAFLTDFKDNYKTDYQKEMVFGRMDPIATFKGTERNITLGFTVPSNEIDEAKFNLFQVNQLVSRLYPVYDPPGGGASTMKGGPIWKIKYGNLITSGPDPTGPVKDHGLPGIINGFSYDPILEEGFMDPVSRDGWTGEMYPQSIRVSFDYTVLHNKKLGWNEDGTWRGDSTRRGDPFFPYGVDPNGPTHHDVATPAGEQGVGFALLDQAGGDAESIAERAKKYAAGYEPKRINRPLGSQRNDMTVEERYHMWLNDPDNANVSDAVRKRMEAFAAQNADGTSARLDSQRRARDYGRTNPGRPFDLGRRYQGAGQEESRRRQAVKAGLLSPQLGDPECGFSCTAAGVRDRFSQLGADYTAAANDLVGDLTFWDDTD